MMLTPIDRIELEGDEITFYRNWTPNSYRPSSYWLDVACQLASDAVNTNDAEVCLLPAGWYIDFRHNLDDEEDDPYLARYDWAGDMRK